MPAAKRRPRDTGAVRKLPSGRYQARFRGADGVVRPAPITFETKQDAAAWLASQLRDLDLGIWTAPAEKERVGTFREYATGWLERRELKPSTKALYADLLEDVVLPGLGHYPLDRITVAAVGHWYDGLDPKHPTKRAHAYSLARSIFQTAFSRDLIPSNPCRVPGAGVKRKAHVTRVATPAELEGLIEAMPGRLRALIVLAACCGLRQGELFELRRGDVDLEAGTVSVERAVTRVKGKHVVGTPKSDAGRRRLPILPHVLPAIREHLEQHVGPPADALLFPSRDGRHLQPSTFYAPFYVAREAVGRPDLRLHDLRHTALTLYAQAGATTRELMTIAGHSSAAMALHYQHAAEGRAEELAAAVSARATGERPALRAVR